MNLHCAKTTAIAVKELCLQAQAADRELLGLQAESTSPSQLGRLYVDFPDSLSDTRGTTSAGGASEGLKYYTVSKPTSKVEKEKRLKIQKRTPQRHPTNHPKLL